MFGRQRARVFHSMWVALHIWVFAALFFRNLFAARVGIPVVACAVTISLAEPLKFSRMCRFATLKPTCAHKKITIQPAIRLLGLFGEGVKVLGAVVCDSDITVEKKYFFSIFLLKEQLQLYSSRSLVRPE